MVIPIRTGKDIKMKTKLHSRWLARVVYYRSLMIEETVKGMLGYYK